MRSANALVDNTSDKFGTGLGGLVVNNLVNDHFAELFDYW